MKKEVTFMANTSRGKWLSNAMEIYSMLMLAKDSSKLVNEPYEILYYLRDSYDNFIPRFKRSFDIPKEFKFTENTISCNWCKLTVKREGN